MVQNVLEGWNGSIMAYGQTASGKTHTMQGNMLDEQSRGLVPRIIEDFFLRIENQSDKIETSVKIQILEIYMEQIIDLLVQENQVKIRNDP